MVCVSGKYFKSVTYSFANNYFFKEMRDLPGWMINQLNKISNT